MAYQRYTEKELIHMATHPAELTAEPYKLFTAYVLDALWAVANESVDDEDGGPRQISFPMTMGEKTYLFVIDDCIKSFTAAASLRLQVDFSFGACTVRNASNINVDTLMEIFSPVTPENGRVRVVPGCALNVTDGEITGRAAKECTQKARLLAMRAWLMGHRDGGWHRLTSAEAAVYCWVRLFVMRPNIHITFNAIKGWHRKNSKYFNLTLPEILAMLRPGKKLPMTPFCFSAGKVERKNKELRQRSSLDLISQADAEEFWYSKLKY